MAFLSDEQQSIIDAFVDAQQYDEAIDYINNFLTTDPTNDELLFMIADIQYKRGEINKASKAVDFINAQSDNRDPMGLYVKGVLEMEKNNWKEARTYLLQAMEMLDKDNAEVLRCYGLSEYWYGNREKGISHIERAYDMHRYDAEIIYNLIQLYLLEHRYQKAKEMIICFYDSLDQLETYDKSLDFYTSKIDAFVSYVENHKLMKKKV